MNPQEVALRVCLEDLKETSALAVQALRDAALQTMSPTGYRQTSVLGAIDAATVRLAHARRAFLTSTTEATA